MGVSKEEFDAAAEWIRSLPKDGPVQASNDEKLKAYGLFKQATVGDNTESKPGMFSGFEAGYKWQAWEDNKGKSQGDAMTAYVAHINALKKKYKQ